MAKMFYCTGHWWIDFYVGVNCETTIFDKKFYSLAEMSYSSITDQAFGTTTDIYVFAHHTHTYTHQYSVNT